jgi:hypothetical protein
MKAIKILSTDEYAKLVNCELQNATLEEIQEYVQENFDLTLWDYPLAEIDYVLNEVNESVCLVRVDNEIRVCEF